MSRGTSLQCKIRVNLRCAIFVRGNLRCAWCRRPLGKATTDEHQAATIDHVITRAYGGSDKPENLVGACNRCNINRNYTDVFARTMREFGRTPKRAWVEVQRQLQKPIDREAGRKLAAEWYPWSVEMAVRSADRCKARRERIAAEGDDSFNFGALASRRASGYEEQEAAE